MQLEFLFFPNRSANRSGLRLRCLGQSVRAALANPSAFALPRFGRSVKVFSAPLPCATFLDVRTLGAIGTCLRLLEFSDPSCAQVLARSGFQASILVTAVIDPGHMTMQLEMLVGEDCPGFTRFLELVAQGNGRFAAAVLSAAS